MGFTCCVAECTNSRKDKVQRGNDLVFHRFPVKDQSICKIWLTKCHRAEKLNPRNCYICSDHFTSADYEDDMRNRLLGLTTKKILKSGAIPSVFPTRTAVHSQSERVERLKLRQRKLTIATAVAEFDSQLQIPDATDTDVSQCNEDEAENSRQLPSANLGISIEPPSHQIIQLQDQVRGLKLKLLQHKLKLKKKRLIERQLKLAISKKEEDVQQVKLTQIDKQCRQIFSDSQLRKLSTQKKIHWTKNDIVKALALRSISLKSYETALEVWKLPLPSVRTLRRWTKLFTCEAGVLYDVMNVLKHCGDSMENFKKICVLSFDEMNIDSSYVIEPTFDKIISHSKVQVILARGICDGWKQPVYYNFDTDLTKNILFAVISEIEACSFPVHALVSDLATTNRGFWKELGVNEYNCSFTNPCDPDRQVHVFGDVPHCLKNLRNHLLDDPMFLEDGSVVTRSDLEFLISKNGTELKLAPKLTMKHLEVVGAERMRVRPAAQLLSHHTASLSNVFLPDEPRISEFFDTINNGFDVLNSRVPIDPKNPLKSGFSFQNNEQVLALEKFKQLITEMRFQMKKSGKISACLLPFQLGFLISVASLKNLTKDLSIRYGVKYILTSRLNQDALESLFSLCRSFGGPNTNPNSSEFRFRLRLILLSSKLRSPSGTNAEFVPDNVSYMSSQLLEMNGIAPSENQENRKIVEYRIPDKSKLSQQISPETSYAEMESLRYLAGYVAWKLKKNGNDTLGIPTRYSQSSESGWIETLSRGGLLVPNQDLCEAISVCERVFQEYFPELKKCPRITEKLAQQIEAAEPSIDKSIIREFLKTRLKIKVRALNSTQNKNVNRKKKLQFAKGTQKLP